MSEDPTPYGSHSEVVGLRLELARERDRANAFEAALKTDVLKIVRVAIIQATIDADNEIARLKSELTNCKSEADRLKAEVERSTAQYNSIIDHQLAVIEGKQAEIDRLNTELFTCSCANANMNKHMNENARLKAEVERLRASSFVTAVPVEEYEKLKAEVERLKSELADEKSANSNVECRQQDALRGLSMENFKLKAEVERSTAWGRGLESDLSHARVEISFLKSEVERLSAADSYLQGANEYAYEKRCDELEAEVERLRKAGDWMCGLLQFDFVTKEWNAAKEGKPSV